MIVRPDPLHDVAVSVVPSAQLLYTHTKTDGFVETGAADALLAALKDRGLKRGVASLCIGGGEATAVAVELV